MKIGFLIKDIHVGAGQTQDIVEITKYLLTVHPEWEISVLAHEIYHPLVEGMNDSRVKIIRIDRYYSAVLLSGKIPEMLKSYDVLYVKGNYPYVFPAVKSGKPTVLVVHQMDSAKLFKGIVPKLKVIAANLMTGYTIRIPDTVVTVSDELATFYNKKFGIKAHVIEDQISDAFFNAQMRTGPDKRQTLSLLTVGPWDGPNGRKRQHVVVKYFSEAVKKEGRLRLTMVGLSEGNISFFQAMVKELSLSDYVALKGFLTEQELRDEYLSNDIFVTATSYEGFYRPVVEAFASGMPALVFDSRTVVNDASASASVNHMVKSGGGRVYTGPESFYSSILDILDHYGDLSKRAHDYSMKFKPENIGKKLVTLMEEILESEKGGS